jgi:hypothetical protein
VLHWNVKALPALLVVVLAAVAAVAGYGLGPCGIFW